MFALLLFGIIIVVHELGHFSVAKFFKVKINEFSIGMGPAFFKKKKKDTLYALRILPIGGYVSMEGEDEESDDENAFNNKACWKRVLIVAAGAIMNILLGFILIIAMKSTSEHIGTNVIAAFDDENATSAHGIMIGDKIIEVNGRSILTVLDLTYNMMSDKDGILDITLKRNGEKIELNNVKFDMIEYEDGTEAIYFDMYILAEKPTFSNVISTSFLETASMIKIVYNSLFDLVTGQFSLRDMAGPIGTVDYIADAASTSVKETDYSYVLMIISLITINIGVFNLLPIPALDGGRLLFLIIEMIRRKPINQKYEKYVHATGFLILILFMVVISASDIIKLVNGG